MRIGLDIHGVIDRDPDIFSMLSKWMRANGHEVHVLTGKELSLNLYDELRKFGIEYDRLFSITSFHKDTGVEVKYKGGDPTQPLIEPRLWNPTKADYCKWMGIGVHIDDSSCYGKYFVGRTKYIIYTPAIRIMLQYILKGAFVCKH
jgi:hypothetical protein